MIKEGLLFLAHRIPFPPNKGDKIRSFHLLRHLSTRYAIHLGAFVDDPDDWQYRDTLKQWCAEVKLLPLHGRVAKLASLRGLLTGEALTLPYYRNRELAQWAQQLADAGTVSRGLAYSSAMAQFMPRNLSRRVMDMVDVDSDKWGQYAPTQPWPMSRVYAREGVKLAAWEARIATDFDATLLVSRDEAALLRRRVPAAAGRIHALENGVDHEAFSPARDWPNPYPADALAIVFTGAMDYWPNVDAVVWFAEEVYPALRERFPQALFVIVGSRPGDKVTRLARRPGVRVTGRVDAVQPYLAHAACVVAPLRIARGVQNKVLEAMAMAKPVVVTPEAAEGIDAVAGHDFELALDRTGFIAAVAAVLAAPAARPAARAAVLARYDWNTNLAALDEHFAAPLIESLAA